jgi:hypothetical protein
MNMKENRADDAAKTFKKSIDLVQIQPLEHRLVQSPRPAHQAHVAVIHNPHPSQRDPTVTRSVHDKPWTDC